MKLKFRTFDYFTGLFAVLIVVTVFQFNRSDILLFLWLASPYPNPPAPSPALCALLKIQCYVSSSQAHVLLKLS